MFKSSKYLSLLILAWILPLGVFADHIIVREAWVNEAPPVARVHAAYMVITNTANRKITLEKVESRDYGRVEIHQSRLEQGQMKMTIHEQVVIEANQDFQLSPGGFHLMLFKPLKPMRAGNIVKLRLYFDQGVSFDLDAVVRKHAP